MNFKPGIKFPKFGKMIFIFLITAIVGILNIGSVMGQMSSPTQTVSPTSNNSQMTDEQWLEKISHLLIIPLDDEQKQILSMQLKVDEQLENNIFKLNDLIRERDGIGHEEARYKEMAVRNSGKNDQATIDQYESDYKKDDTQCLELTRAVRSQLGNNDIDLFVWLSEENLIRNTVWEMSSRKELADGSNATNRINEKLGKSKFLKTYENNIATRFSKEIDRKNFLIKHHLYLQKRIAFHILNFKSSDYLKQKRWKEFLEKKKEIIQETSFIGQ